MTSLVTYWAETGAYKTIHCYYEKAGDMPEGHVQFWYADVPPGLSGLLDTVESRVGLRTENIGVFSLGGSGVTACPKDFREATELKEALLKSRMTYNETESLAGFEDMSSFADRLALFTYGLNNSTDPDKFRELARPIVNGNEYHIFSCTYGPVGFEFVKYLYWKDKAPPQWPELRKMIKVPKEPFQLLALSNKAYRSCPETLADARKRASLEGEPEPYHDR